MSYRSTVQMVVLLAVVLALAFGTSADWYTNCCP